MFETVNEKTEIVDPELVLNDLDVTANDTSLKLLDVSRYNTADESMKPGPQNELTEKKALVKMQAGLSIKFAIAYIESNQFLLSEVQRQVVNTGSMTEREQKVFNMRGDFETIE